MFNEATNFAIVQTELDSVFFQKFEQEASFPSTATAETGAIFKPQTTEHAAYIEEVFKGSELFEATGETGAVKMAVPKVANKLTTYVKDYTKGIELSKNLFDDQMHGVYSEMIADMARVARATQNDNAFALFRGAFTTTLCADAVALCSASHLTVGNVTVDNLVTGALSPATLNDAIVKLGEQKNEAGVIMGSQPSVLLVPPKLFKHALEITDSALIADVANNNINVYRSAYGITVYTSPFLGAAAGGSDTAWFLLGNNHSVTRIVRQGIVTSLRDWSMSNNRTYFYQANFREAIKVANYVGVVGSTGL
jgi:hypothetical protein